ncbi:septum formation inhibitor Maf [Flavobacteriaceae bacterium D16]|nr:septum formation inhibitor Maf [Flavobacteriaceae bacterium D16]
MKRMARYGFFLILLCSSGIALNSCNDSVKGSEPKKAYSNIDLEKQPDVTPLSKEFKSYWYAGEAEISSFELEQVRYGEIRKGSAVQVFVTEPFLADKQVKADYSKNGNIPVLKLNSTKKFLTGIYPYSIMTSTFSPVDQEGHAIKISNSVQEWCGQVYTQLNNRDSFEIVSHSYFEGEADQNLSMEKVVLEDELWNLIRLRPETLPTGTFSALPSMEYLRLNHQDFRAYEVSANRIESEGLISYTLKYPELGRTLTINFTQDFPYQIEGWSESMNRGSGSNSKNLTSTARRIKSIKTAYWRQNRNRDLVLRDSLSLP